MAARGASPGGGGGGGHAWPRGWGCSAGRAQRGGAASSHCGTLLLAACACLQGTLDVPVAQLMAAGMPSHQFVVAATIGPPLDLFRGDSLPANLCGMAYNFGKMVPADNPDATVRRLRRPCRPCRPACPPDSMHASPAKLPPRLSPPHLCPNTPTLGALVVLRVASGQATA